MTATMIVIAFTAAYVGVRSLAWLLDKALDHATNGRA